MQGVAVLCLVPVREILIKDAVCDLTAESDGLLDSTLGDVPAFWENLSGTSRGQVTSFLSDQLFVSFGTDRVPRISPDTATTFSSIARAILS
jgi:hypothetical protein